MTQDDFLNLSCCNISTIHWIETCINVFKKNADLILRPPSSLKQIYIIINVHVYKLTMENISFQNLNHLEWLNPKFIWYQICFFQIKMFVFILWEKKLENI